MRGGCYTYTVLLHDWVNATCMLFSTGEYSTFQSTQQQQKFGNGNNCVGMFFQKALFVLSVALLFEQMSNGSKKIQFNSIPIKKLK